MWIRAMLAAALLAAPPVRAVDEVKLPEAAGGAASHPETGAVAVTFPSADKVRVYPKLFDGSDRDAKTIDCPKASEVVFKQVGNKAYWCVLTGGSEPSLVVFDAKSLEKVRAVKLKAGLCRSPAASVDPADPMVYCVAANGDRRIVALDLSAGTEALVAGSGNVGIVSVSADGRTAYWTDPYASAGVRAARLDRPDDAKSPPALLNPTFWTPPAANAPVRTYGAQLAIDPRNLSVVAGADVLSPNLDARQGTIGGPAHLISAKRPLIVGVAPDVNQRNDRSRFQVWSSNTYKSLADVELPFAVAEFRRPGDGVTGPAVLEDKEGKRFVVVRGTSACVVTATDLNLTDEPDLAVKLDARPEAFVGKPMKVKALPLFAEAAVTLGDAPIGFGLGENVLSWTPGPEDVGSHSVKLKVAAKGISREAEFRVEVGYPSVDVGFRVADMAVSPDGKLALAIGSRESALTPNYQPGYPGGPGHKLLALIDLDGSKIVARREMPAGVRTAAIDDTYVYVASSEADAVLVLERATLADKKRLFTNGQPTAIMPTGKYVWLVTQTESTVLTVPELELAPRTSPGFGPFLRAAGKASGRGPVRDGDNWMIDGMLFSRDLSKAVGATMPAGSVYSNRGLTRYAAGTVVYDPRYPQDGLGTFGPGAWGVTPRNGQLMSGRRAVVTADRSPRYGETAEALDVLPDKPAGVRVRFATPPQNQPQPGGVRAKVELQFLELEAGAAIDKVVLAEEVRNNSGGYQTQPQVGVAARPGRVVARSQSRVFAFDTAKLDVKKYPAPLHVPAPAPLKLVGSEPVEFTLPAPVGGTKPVTFAAESDVPGVSVDKAGKVKVDPAALRLAITGPTRQFFMPNDADSLRVCEALTGEKPKGVAIWVSLPLVARDAELREIPVSAGFYLDMPPTPPENRPPVGVRPEPAEPVNPPGGVGPGAAKQPIDPARLSPSMRAMYQRIVDLEAEVERLKKPAPKAPGKAD